MSDDKRPIYVTQPFLPPLEDFTPLLRQIWDSKVLTNGGPFHQRLEAALCEYLGVPHISLFTNATIALVTALQALRITGEVITTPYSFVATAHSLVWNGIEPVFADVDPDSLNLDPAKIEAAITPKTTAIMPVHCYGRPCDTAAIQRIADTYNLKVIYDAAHAFGVAQGGDSVLNHGDLSVLSFHATKVFNTFEGGAIISPDAKTKKRIDHLKNFGFVDETVVVAPGINGKMSEFNAALGLLQLEHVHEAFEGRARVDAMYRERLAGLPGIDCVAMDPTASSNHSYFPVLVRPNFRTTRDGLYAELRAANIYARRYFFPLISDFPMYRGLPSAAPANVPVARAAAEQVLCLPIFPTLDESQLDRIVAVIRGGLRPMRLAIMQPYFLPYVGYWQLMGAVDAFVVYDRIKYTKKGWINRNRLLQNGEAVTFSLPLAAGSDSLMVSERELATSFERRKLLAQFEGAYRKAPQFDAVRPLLAELVLDPSVNLFDYLWQSIVKLRDWLGLETRLIVSSQVPHDESLKAQDKVLALCKALGATRYINAIGGLELYERDAFAAAGVGLQFHKAKRVEYPQFGAPFQPWLSILDLLMFQPREAVLDAVHTQYELI